MFFFKFKNYYVIIVYVMGIGMKSKYLNLILIKFKSGFMDLLFMVLIIIFNLL